MSSLATQHAPTQFHILFLQENCSTLMETKTIEQLSEISWQNLLGFGHIFLFFCSGVLPRTLSLSMSWAHIFVTILLVLAPM